MKSIDTGSLVVVHCANPKEKVWGVVIRLDAVGATIRGLELNSVEDWLRQERTEEPPLIRPSTFFIPMHRIIRIDLEESGSVVVSYADRYATACGGDVRDALFGRPEATSRAEKGEDIQ